MSPVGQVLSTGCLWPGDRAQGGTAWGWGQCDRDELPPGRGLALKRRPLGQGGSIPQTQATEAWPPVCQFDVAGPRVIQIEPPDVQTDGGGPWLGGAAALSPLLLRALVGAGLCIEPVWVLNSVTRSSDPCASACSSVRWELDASRLYHWAVA